jgi:hypothetical protein
MDRIIIETSFLDREDLSLEAKGLFTYLLTRTKDYVIDEDKLCQDLNEKMSVVKSALKELREKKVME